MPTAESPQTKIQPEPTITAPDPEHSDNGFVTRDEWLAQAGKFSEKTITVAGLGKLLLVELSGLARAQIQAQQSAGLLADAKRVDVAAYQRAVLLGGVADPSSPEGARRPLFQAGDMDRVMGIGGGKLAEVVDEIEKLSGLDVGATKRAEENSDGTPSAAGTS
jgi:hypothetical protein